jgi:exopolysaccharide biosynthesis WecB/TagA/CpsF family protein
MDNLKAGKVNILGISVPQLSRKLLLTKISQSKTTDRLSLYFLYSEFFLRANRNPFYKDVLQKAKLLALDGRGSVWSWKYLRSSGALSKAYSKLLFLPAIILIPIFLIIFLIQLILSFIDGWLSIVSKRIDHIKGLPEAILGREFVYDLLDLANQKRWKVAVIGGWDNKNGVLADKIEQKYPNLILQHWYQSPDSDLMKDQWVKTEGEAYPDHITTQNILQKFPELEPVVDFLKINKPDIILVALGGASGKQETLINYIQEKEYIKYRLATGIGAAMDHLGGGKEQLLAPLWVQKLGLEWLFRFVFLPYRRGRVADSILTFWWWVSLQKLLLNLRHRATVVNLVTANNMILTTLRKPIITGDIGWSFVQGGVENWNYNEFIKQLQTPDQLSQDNLQLLKITAVKELKEETKLEVGIASINQVYFSQIEYPSISLLRTVVLGCKYFSQAKWVATISLENNPRPIANWENERIDWTPLERLEDYVVPQKLTDYKS